MHLVIDGYGGDPKKLWDAELVRSFLKSYPARLGMTRISEPHVSTWEAPDPGLSGFVIIAESHICIHTFPRRDYVNIDIFSCRPFDNEQALRDVVSLFLLDRFKSWLLERGLEFADSMPATDREALQQASSTLPTASGD